MSDKSAKTAGGSPARTGETEKMTAASEAQSLISEIAFGLPPHAGIKEMLSLVARRTGLGDRRLRGIWNNEARVIRAEELDALRRAAARRQEEQEADARQELRDVLARLDFLEHRMATLDPNFVGSLAHAGSAASGNARGSDRSLARGK